MSSRQPNRLATWLWSCEATIGPKPNLRYLIAPLLAEPIIDESVSKTFSIVLAERFYNVSVVTKACILFTVKSTSGHSPSSGRICRRKCDSADRLVLGFSAAAACTRHSSTARFTVSEVLGIGGVAWLAALTASRIG